MKLATLWRSIRPYLVRNKRLRMEQRIAKLEVAVAVREQAIREAWAKKYDCSVEAIRHYPLHVLVTSDEQLDIYYLTGVAPTSFDDGCGT